MSRQAVFSLSKVALSPEFIEARVQGAANDPRVSRERMEAFAARNGARAEELQTQRAAVPAKSRKPEVLQQKRDLTRQAGSRSAAQAAGAAALESMPARRPAPVRVQRPVRGPGLGTAALGAGAMVAGYGAYRMLRDPTPQQYKLAAEHLPDGLNLDEEPGKLNWKTPSGHTVRMPFRSETFQHHTQRLGPDGAKDYLRKAVDQESHQVDKDINEGQASWMNNHPRTRNGMFGGVLGGILGGVAGNAAGHTGKGLLAGAGIGALLAQIGKQNIRKGPETYDYSDDYEPADLPKAFYHLSPEENRKEQHMRVMEHHAQSGAMNRHYDHWEREAHHREMLRALGGTRY